MKHPEEFRKEMPLGLNNCRSRLSGLFPDRYSLDIKEENGFFQVSLNINLKKHA